MTRSMNQEKIGRLIAKLRKQKDLTQRELGEMVGVGYRAVSKWERGLTMPDISIINELSEILGISSDELLKGELVPKDDNQAISTSDKDSKPVKNGNKRKLLLLIVSLLMIIAIVGITVIRNSNKSKEYTIQSLHPEEYQVEGKLFIEGKKMIIKIKKIKFQDYNFSQIIINNCDYKVMLNDKYIFGFINENEYNLNNKTINEFFEDFIIDYNEKTKITKKDFLNSNLKLILLLKDTNNNIIEKNIELQMLKA